MTEAQIMGREEARQDAKNSVRSLFYGAKHSQQIIAAYKNSTDVVGRAMLEAAEAYLEEFKLITA